MKRAAVLVVLGLLVPMIQGGLAPFLPHGACPDVGLLLVIALGMALRSAAGGLALAAWIGFVCDVLSGSLLGELALVRVLVYGGARLASSHVNLQGAFTKMVLAAGLTLVSAIGMGALTAFFSSGAAAPLATPRELLWHIAVNALLAPVVIGLSARLIVKLGDDDGRRVLRLEPRRYSA